MMVRWTVYFAGRVQGVGFRWTTREVAARHVVAGCVENLPDGRVRLIAEGSPDDVKAFVEDVQRTMGRYIRDTRIDRTEATGEWGDAGEGTFTIRH